LEAKWKEERATKDRENDIRQHAIISILKDRCVYRVVCFKYSFAYKVMDV
jgi:hypothetical protein